MPKLKMNFKLAQEIRAKLAIRYTVKELAFEYKVSQSTIHRIKNNQIWMEEDGQPVREVKFDPDWD